MADLFYLEESLSPRLKWEKALEIQTHHADIDESPWLAVSMTICNDRLKGHDLTDREKTDIGELFAGYCRLLDEMQIVGYGQTREEAITDLIRNAKIKPPGA